MLAVLFIPGALRAFVPALIGRSSLAMGGLALLLAVQDSTGSFAQAGLTTAAFGFANVIAAPWRARAVDRWGQQLPLTAMAICQAAGLALLAFVGWAGEPGGQAYLPVLGAVIGLSAPPLGSAMRMIWASLTVPGDQRRKAFSLDAVCEELLFVGCPVAVTAVIMVSSPGAGLLTTAAAVLLGTVGMTSAQASRAIGGIRSGDLRGDRPLHRPGFVKVLVVLLGVGTVLGVVEIAAPAVAAHHDLLEVSGWLLAAFAAGSCLGGLIYGHLGIRAGLGKSLFMMCTGMGIAAVLASQLDSIWFFAGGLGVIGLFLAPSLVTGYLIADHFIPETGRTEASTWINTSVNLGSSFSAAAAGIIVDSRGAWFALLMAGALAVSCALLVPFAHLRTARM